MDDHKYICSSLTNYLQFIGQDYLFLPKNKDAMIQKLSEFESNTAKKTKLFAENFFGKCKKI